MEPTTSVSEPTTQVEPKPKTDAKGEKSLVNQTEDDATPEGAPEAYADFTLPEGVTLDAETVKEATAVFKELNLPQAAAQKLVDFYTGKMQAAMDAPMQLWKEQQEKWVAEVKADPQLGKNLKGTLSNISKAIDTLAEGNPKLATEFREAMDFTGAGNNPAFIRMMAAIAARVTEGTHVTGNGPTKESQARPGGEPKSLAQRLFPNLA